tara:strand:- start:2966 stop:3820 length:855 start_codon:yes stop_codon:yes gene_type:complete
MLKKFYLLFALFCFGYTFGYKTRDFARTFIIFPLLDILTPNTLIKVNELSYKLPKEVECPTSSLQIAYFGQSNSANTVKPKAELTIPENIFQYDWQSKKCYRYKEPLIGTDENLGNVITYTALEIASRINKPVLVIPFGKSSSSVSEWAYSNLFFHQSLVFENIKAANLYPDVFLWHQGESDVSTSKTDYMKALEVVVDRTLENFPNTYFGIALATRCQSLEWLPVREAQQAIISSNKKTFLSADSDKIYDPSLRYDSCHFSAKGAERLGDEYAETIIKALRLN